MHQLRFTVIGSIALVVSAIASCSDDHAASPNGNEAGPPAPPVVGNGPGCQVLAVMQGRCSSCHGSTPTNGAPMSLDSLDDLRALSVQFPGESIASRCRKRMNDTNSPMPPAPAARASADEIGAVDSWIREGMPACAPDGEAGSNGPVDPNLIPQDELFNCDPNVLGGSPARILRLNRAEMARSLPADHVLTFAQNPFSDNPGAPYTTYGSDESLNAALLDLYMDPGLNGGGIGSQFAQRMSSRADSIEALRCFRDDDHPNDTCIDRFVLDALQNTALHRPPTDSEKAHLRAFVVEQLNGETGAGARTRTIERTGAALWLTSGALFRRELGGTEPRSRLDPWELANAIAYALTYNAAGGNSARLLYGEFSAPLEEGELGDLQEAARDGSIFDPAKLDALLRAHAGGVDPDRADLAPVKQNPDQRRVHGQWWASAKIAAFFREWFAYGNFPTLFKDQPGKTSQFDPDTDGITVASYDQLQTGFYGTDYGTETTMVEQLDDTIARVVAEDQDVLKRLLTTTQFYVAATSDTFQATRGTQHPYNLTGPIGPEGRWVTLPAGERSGILTHPGWLAAHGGNFDDDPSLIERGHWVRTRLLCQYVPPLSEVRVQAVVGPSAPEKTARSRVVEATASESCQGCHKLMNSLGFPFEIYNHAGFLREVDHDGNAPNGSSTLVDMPDPSLNGPVADAVELNQKLAQSNYVQRCFVRQTFRYFAGRDETRADACSLVKMEQAYAQRGSFYAMLSALLASEAFQYRLKGAP